MILQYYIILYYIKSSHFGWSVTGVSTVFSRIQWKKLLWLELSFNTWLNSKYYQNPHSFGPPKHIPYTFRSQHLSQKRYAQMAHYPRRRRYKWFRRVRGPAATHANGSWQDWNPLFFRSKWGPALFSCTETNQFACSKNAIYRMLLQTLWYFITRTTHTLMHSGLIQVLQFKTPTVFLRLFIQLNKVFQQDGASIHRSDALCLSFCPIGAWNVPR